MGEGLLSMTKNLHFKTNSRHIGQLGRELVTDFVTALVELVKNSYDADAGSVQIRIEAANTPESRIIIADTGCGMTPSEFENRWMVIGTGNKLASPYTPKGRKKAGKKGIGRFSVERLAEKVRIYSYTDSDACKVSINWNLYEEISASGLKQRIKILRSKEDADAARYISNQIEYYLSLNLEGNSEKEQKYIREQIGDIINNYELAYESSFLEVLENQCLPVIKKQEMVELKLEDVDNLLEEIVDREKEESYRILKELYQSGPELKQMPYTGIVMVLEHLRDNWRQKDIDKLQKELQLLVAPEFIEKDPFHIELAADQFEIPEEISVNSILDLRFARLTAQISEEGSSSEMIYSDIDGREETFTTKYDRPLLCGDLTFELYYFLRDSAHMANETYNYRLAVKILDIYCGIKIYRDSFRVKPYGDLDNDWLGLDRKKISDTHSYRVGNNQTIGVIRISDEKNPLLIDATNREGIIENEAFEDLREFILECINVISEIRREESRKRQSELERAKAERKKYQKKAAEHRKEQESRYKNSLELIQTGASYDSIKLSLDHWREEEEQFQKETKKQYEKTEEAYQSYLEYQETELSMYKNLATLGILAGNFGHETQDIISRINNTLAFYSELAPYINNPYFGEITENIVSDFSRISGYSSMIVEFLRKRKRTPKKNLEFGEVLDVVSALYVGMLEAFHIHFTWESEDSICLTMRQIDLESVIINMITNAFEQVKTKREREIFIKFEQRDNDIYLYFEDSGNGVPEDQREDIFRAFRTSKEDGIGLGLNIVKDIVTSYGGAIFVTESEKLGGAKFVVHFVKKEGSS